ncbi:MAG TPA: hypothetical protein VLK35_17860 [Methylomirabilota bacterium]|nr:hypothetical protein [Methylomirabilota bacterium]
MSKSWVFALLTLTIALGLIGLLAYTSESVHPAGGSTPAERARARNVSAPAERESGPTFHRNGLLLTH